MSVAGFRRGIEPNSRGGCPPALKQSLRSQVVSETNQSYIFAQPIKIAYQSHESCPLPTSWARAQLLLHLSQRMQVSASIMYVMV